MEPDLVLLTRVAHRGREVTSRRVQDLLALLAAELPHGVGTARLVEGLWPEDRPEHPGKALQVLVSRARAQLGAALIASTPTGYRLALPPEQVDVWLLRRAAAAVRPGSGGSAGADGGADGGGADGDPARVLAVTGPALDRWDGSAGGSGPLRDLRDACRAPRRALARAHALATARAGRAGDALDPLAALADDDPADEEVLAELLRAHAAVSGPVGALERYETHRRRLRDGLGADPGPALRRVHAELLRASVPAVRSGVAHEPNPLLGRDGDVAAVTALLRGARVVSIVGPGGLGKTRLAHAVARVAPQRVVRFVGLAGVTRDGDVAAEVAAAVAGAAGSAAPHRAAADPVTAIAESLGGGLLVLDNGEHVLDGAAALVAGLVARSRDARVLTTSRAPLGLSSEAVHLLAPLGPDVAARLFAQRARAARPGVALPAGAVSRLCDRLDGLPLAIELAAARVRTLSVPEIADRMDDRFALLRGAHRDAPDRHRTLHAVVDWSWALLSPADRTALATLSVLPGGFTAATAEHLGTVDALEHLVEQSLLGVTDTPSGVRYRMLETVRAFAAAHRDDAAVTAFLGWAREVGLARHEALLGPDPAEALGTVRAEQDNLLHALRLAVTRRDDATAVATAAALMGLWTVENSFSRVLALADEIGHPLSHVHPDPDLVEVVRTVAVLAASNHLAISGPRASRALVVLRRLPAAPPDTPVRAQAALLGRSVEEVLARSGGPDSLLTGVANAMASYVHEALGNPDAALASARRMAALVRPYPLLEVLAQSRLGEQFMLREQGREAFAAFSAAADAYARLSPTDTIGLRWALVQAALQAGDVVEAERRLDAATAAGPQGAYGAVTASLALRAEVRLVAGALDEGLALWRQAVDALADEPTYPMVDEAPDPWACELRSALLVAHARAGRTALVPGLAGELTGVLTGLLAHPLATPLPSFPELPVCGALLLAVATADLAAGHPDPAVRMIALACRLRFPHNFHPTMSSALARADAEAADAAGYAAAVRASTALPDDRLRAEALHLLAQRRGSRA